MNKIKKIISKLKNNIKKYIYSREYKRYKKYCEKNKQKEFIIFNTPIHGNIGDHAIIYAEYKILEKLKIKAFEVPTYKEEYYFEYIKNNVSKNAIISITGGGFIGSQWKIEQNLVNKVVEQFANYKIIIFPQTIYFKEDENGKEELKKSIEIFDKALNLTIFARESKTYEFASKTYKKAKVILVPDIVLSLDYKENLYERNGVLLCLRKDVEGIFSQEDKEKLYNKLEQYNKKIFKTDTVVDYSISPQKRNKEIEEKLKEFASSELVITDRLHGMIFATITNTPCIVFSNYNYKVEGVYQWIKNVDKNIIFEKDLNNIQNDIKQLLNKQIDNTEKKYYDFNKLLEEIING